MTYAVVYAQKIPMELMIPPLDQKEMPLELRTLEHITPLMAEQAKANFEVRPRLSPLTVPLPLPPPPSLPYPYPASLPALPHCTLRLPLGARTERLLRGVVLVRRTQPSLDRTLTLPSTLTLTLTPTPTLALALALPLTSPYSYIPNLALTLSRFIGQKNGWQNCWDVDDSAKDDAEPFPAAWQVS